MSKPILVPLDGSELSQRALPYAAALARTSARPLILVRVLTPKPPRGEELVQEDEARADLNANAERLRAEGLAVLTVLASTLGGDVAQVILEHAEAHGCDLIVMSTHGRSGLSRWVYGSTAEKVLRQAPLPLLLVPATSDQEWPTNGGLQVLVPFDGSAEAESALEPMLASIRDITKHVLLLQVVVAPRGGAAAYMFEDLPAEIEVARASLERVAQMLRGEGLTVGIQVVAGSVAASIASVARQESVDLIAMATHGRSGFARLVLGSVAAETLQRATTPLLVLRPAGLADSPSTESSVIHAPELTHRFTILAALDVTDKADAALGPTARLARAMGARVVLVNVFRPATDMSHVHAPTRAAIEYVRAERRLYLEDKTREMPGVDVEARVEVLAHGEEIDQRIAAVAAEIAADMVVVVSKRVSNAASLVIGSVAQVIVRSPCPVLIVSPTAITVSEDEELRLPLYVSSPT